MGERHLRIVRPPTTTPQTSYPEHDKLDAIKDLSEAQYEFIEWLSFKKGISLCVQQDNEFYPALTSMTNLLAEYHGIHLGRLDDEKRAMLQAQRELNDQ